MSRSASPFEDPRALGRALATTYLADGRTEVTAFLALTLEKPILVEGPPGAGKTDLARALAEVLGRPMVRLQCYEGLDEQKALYEWNYGKQMLQAQLERSLAAQTDLGSFYTEAFLLPRPLLAALTSEVPVVLLVDEVDRSDPEFEALLLEVLAEGQVSIPELGTVRAKHAPLVVLTSNGTRDMTDALRRRCLHLHLGYPPPSRELAIVKLKVPGIEDALAEALVAFVQSLRRAELRKAPAISETLDWARALMRLGARALDPGLVESTLDVLVKYEDDRTAALGAASKLTP